MKGFLCFFVFTCMLKYTMSQTANPAQYKYVFTVAKDGSGDFTSIQKAIDVMRVYPLAPITLYIKDGVYQEKIELPATNTDVRFIGESVEHTIIQFNDYAGKDKHTTFTSYTAKISGNRFLAENISFINTAGAVGQALALYVDADQAVFRNCRFIGNQDTIFAAGEQSRQYFDHCFIEGTTDFIFGPSTAVFHFCTISAKANSYITAASTTKGKPFGFVLMDCTIIADEAVNKLYLGRPWRAFAKTVFIRCTLPASISAEGWNNWGNSANEATVYYAEYQNTGAGAIIEGRVKWSHQLNKKTIKLYTLNHLFSTTTTKKESEPAWYLPTGNHSFVWEEKNEK